MTSRNAVEVEHLVRRYGSFTAVDDVSFTIAEGETFALLGPNGAGKSTTMKMIAGFLRPDAGHVRVARHDVTRDGLAARRALGYLPEGAPGYGEMEVADFLGFVADVRGLTGDARLKRMGFDPALAGGVILTTVTDTMGFLAFLGLATLVLMR